MLMMMAGDDADDEAMKVEAVDRNVRQKVLMRVYIDFQSVHVSYNRRLVGHKILSPEIFHLMA